MVKHPDKWRETIDPFTLKINNFEIKEILGYPHAGNDVFHICGIYKDQFKEAFLKVERQKTANIRREVEVIKAIDLKEKPKILDYSLDRPRFLITEKVNGERLSSIVGNNENFKSITYMDKYAQLLSRVHREKTFYKPVLKRDLSINQEYYIKENLEYVWEFLQDKDIGQTYCFIHGDCHYANILWEEGQVSCLLDYELSGYGPREFDLAWALVLRPGQKFLDTHIERSSFLSEYSRYHYYSPKALDYYLVQVAMFFYAIDSNPEYRKKLIKMIDSIIDNRL